MLILNISSTILVRLYKLNITTGELEGMDSHRDTSIGVCECVSRFALSEIHFATVHYYNTDVKL